jgi:hypothetical protein
MYRYKTTCMIFIFNRRKYSFILNFFLNRLYKKVFMIKFYQVFVVLMNRLNLELVNHLKKMFFMEHYIQNIYTERKGNYVQPTIVTDLKYNSSIVHQETFLYVLKCKVLYIFNPKLNFSFSFFF